MKKALLLKIALLCSISMLSQSTWMPCSTGLWGGFVRASAFSVYNNQLIVGGHFWSAGSAGLSDNIVAWNGTNWSAMGAGLNNDPNYGEILSLAVFNNELYAGGYVSSNTAAPINCIAKWNGTSWENVVSSIESFSTNPAISSMTVYNNELYVAGSFTSIGGVLARNIAKWNGTTWSSLGNGLVENPTTSNSYMVRSMLVFNNELYVGGSFNMAGTVSATNIAKWNGTVWSTLGEGIPTYTIGAPTGVTCLGVYSSEIYAGSFAQGLSKWNGIEWVHVGGGFGGPNKGAMSLTNYSGKLIVGGSFNVAGIDSVNNIAAWDNIGWSKVVGVNNGDGLNSFVNALGIYNNELYAGGRFTVGIVNQQLTDTLNGIAHFQGTVGIREYSQKSNVIIYPNPSTGKITLTGLIDRSSIEVFDLTGRIVFSLESDRLDAKIDLSKFIKGIYIYKITDSKNKIQMGKIILEN